MKFSQIILFLTFFSILQYSCSDPCEKVECNNGSCEEGICSCEDGYGGEFCDQRLSTKFDGLWQGNFTCDDLNKDAQLQIIEDAIDLRKLTLYTVGLTLQFDGLSFTLDETALQATINAEFTAFSIDTQTMIIQIPNSIGISADVFGEGILNLDDKLSLTINVKNDDFGAFFSCSGLANKEE